MPSSNPLLTLPGMDGFRKRVEATLLASVAAEDELMAQMGGHLITAGGKRARPLFTVCSAAISATDPAAIEALVTDDVIRGGVAVELVQVGSLCHDDVIDEADTRRGAPSVNANWSNTVAILAGDFLMARASEVAATHLSQESVRLLAATYAELVEGQTRELQLQDSLGHSIDAYERVIAGKTASLIRTSARLGAMAADADAATVDALSTWSWELGMVFQIVDDALDLVATEEALGKPAGSDIREGTFTRAVLEAVQGPDGDRIRALLDRPRPYPDEAVEEVIRLVREGGYVDRTLEAAMQRVRVATDALGVLPASPTREILATLGEYLVARVDAARAY